MQAAALGSEPGTAPIARLPDEVLGLLFCFLDPKTLVMAVPAVSAWGGREKTGEGGRRHGDAQLSARKCTSCWACPAQECGRLAGETFVCWGEREGAGGDSCASLDVA